MAKPTNKLELLRQSQGYYERLLSYLDALSAAALTADFPPGSLNRNVRDVLAHLHHWHLLFLDWYKVGMRGDKPAMPAPGYSWKTTAALNKEIWHYYQHHTLADIRQYLADSHLAVNAIIEQHTDVELFTKRRYAWTGSTSLGAYLISATSSHYDWAWKLVRKGLR